MIRLIVFLVVLTAAAFGLAWLADRPGEIVLTWQGYRIETSVLVGLGFLCVTTILLMVSWSIIRFIFRIPSLMSVTARARRQKKGYEAVSKGMVAAAVGDQKSTERAARVAVKQLGNVPLATLLQAQAAQISGDRERATQTFQAMLEDPDTKVLGLRGLYLEAQRRGDSEAARAYANEAYGLTPLPWAGQALLEHHALADDWSGALAVVESSIARKAIDKATGNRQRGVLKTAIAIDIAERDPDEALRIAREAIKLAPELIPAYVVAGQALARKGDIRRGARILEDGWRKMPHPDLARAYLELRPGDSATDRLDRAKTLTRLHSTHLESRLVLARTALEARDFDLARKTVAPLIAADAPRPTGRVCLLMADLEETEHGVGSGRVREWLSRATRAPRDPMWIADGISTDKWAPASPVTGKLDAFVWEPPVERLQAPPVTEDDDETKTIAPILPPKDDDAKPGTESGTPDSSVEKPKTKQEKTAAAEAVVAGAAVTGLAAAKAAAGQKDNTQDNPARDTSVKAEIIPPKKSPSDPDAKPSENIAVAGEAEANKSGGGVSPAAGLTKNAVDANASKDAGDAKTKPAEKPGDHAEISSAGMAANLDKKSDTDPKDIKGSGAGPFNKQPPGEKPEQKMPAAMHKAEKRVAEQEQPAKPTPGNKSEAVDKIIPGPPDDPGPRT